MTGFPVSNVRSQTASESCAVSETAVVLFLSLFQSDSLFSSVLCPSAESVFTSTAAAPEKTDTKAVDKQENRAYIDVQEILPRVSADEAAVLRQLEGGKQPVDRMIDETQLPAGRVLSALTLLEVKGFVKRLPARYYELAKK